MELTDNFRLNGVPFVESPNYDERPAGVVPSLLVVHCISLPVGEFGTEFVDQLFTNKLDVKSHPSFHDLRDVRVSSHVYINRQGGITQYVAFDKRAWHAGESNYDGRRNCNDYSIGIELEGTDDTTFTDPQYEVLCGISQALMYRFPAITLSRVVGHQEIAPLRKSDPGTGFDWKRYLSGLNDR